MVGGSLSFHEKFRRDPLAQRNALNTKLNYNYKLAKVMENEIAFARWHSNGQSNFIARIFNGTKCEWDVHSPPSGPSSQHNRKRLRQLFARDINIRRQAPNDFLNIGLYSTRQPGYYMIYVPRTICATIFANSYKTNNKCRYIL